MIKTTILTVTILFAATMMMQEVYAQQSADFNISGTGVSGQAIPDWVRNNFEWYVDGQIDEKTLLTSMNWMFDNNVMHLSEKAALEVKQMREEIDDLKYENEELMAAIAIPNLIEARKGANEATSTPTVDDITIEGDSGGSTGDMGYKYIPVYIQGTWHNFIMSKATGDAEIDINALIQQVLRESYTETNKDLQFYADKVRYYNDMKEAVRDSLTEARSYQTTNPDVLNPDILNPDSYNPADSSGETRLLRISVTTSAFASETVDDIMTKGGTTSAWEDGIAAFSDHGMRDSVVDDLQGIVVLCNTEIDKKSQTIDAEQKMIEEWLEIIEEKQEKETATTDTSDRLATAPTEEKTDYNQSDLDFITRKLAHIDQQINSLDTGIKVLEEKLQSVGDDAQLANIDLQNSLQKQQQILQTMSNVSKMQHDTLKAIISNMRA